MAKLSRRNVELYLQKYGWSFHDGDDENTWIAGWQGETHAFPLVIELCDTWLSMTVSPLMNLGVDWNSWPEISRILLEMNNDCKLVKLGIDENGEISLSLQFFTEEVPYEEFSDGLGVIGYYTEQIYEELSHLLSEVGFFASKSTEYLT